MRHNALDPRAIDWNHNLPPRSDRESKRGASHVSIAGRAFIGHTLLGPLARPRLALSLLLSRLVALIVTVHDSSTPALNP